MGKGDVMVNVTMKEVQLSNGETIAYREREGGEKKVLLIHGNMTSSKHWDLVLNNMSEEYKLYALDLRGFGKSSYNKLITSIKDFSDDVKLFVDEIDLKDFAIIGWSTGGAVAMQFAADNPGYCNKLILLASESTRGYPFDGKTSVNEEPRRFSSYEDIKRDLIRTIPVQAAYDTNNVDLLKLIWNAVIYTKNQPEPELYDEYVQDMRTQRNLAEVHHSNNTFNISHYHNGLVEGNGLVDQINVPVLVLRGDRDFVVSAEMTKELVEDLGQKAKFVELTDCGHSPLVDDLPQLLKELTNFLKNEVFK
ncbi:intracellular short-chain-length polyhydroxyalkanoate depolymerase [Bacillus sp. 7884-1]|jgi:pimeloyl-ACP methyl ester carboxylesterase|uniref:intracellular short-chain-length polyhydroxyalkanoate depolymerase n=1 Tax=Bacillus sp. 7884-1 TaxID=2021693 RepID=UPI000BA5C27F|nr:alpha/beta hydrolase [Bacillus sp. 7884-1]PAE42955.1 alpha/beta hydrolase [Bacillus sp. 7884-1]